MGDCDGEVDITSDGSGVGDPDGDGLGCCDGDEVIGAEVGDDVGGVVTDDEVESSVMMVVSHWESGTSSHKSRW